jgi:hypothetical protein
MTGAVMIHVRMWNSRDLSVYQSRIATRARSLRSAHQRNPNIAMPHPTKNANIQS